MTLTEVQPRTSNLEKVTEVSPDDPARPGKRGRGKQEARALQHEVFYILIKIITRKKEATLLLPISSQVNDEVEPML